MMLAGYPLQVRQWDLGVCTNQLIWYNVFTSIGLFVFVCLSTRLLKATDFHEALVGG